MPTIGRSRPRGCSACCSGGSVLTTRVRWMRREGRAPAARLPAPPAKRQGSQRWASQGTRGSKHAQDSLRQQSFLSVQTEPRRKGSGSMLYGCKWCRPSVHPCHRVGFAHLRPSAIVLLVAGSLIAILTHRTRRDAGSVDLARTHTPCAAIDAPPLRQNYRMSCAVSWMRRDHAV